MMNKKMMIMTITISCHDLKMFFSQSLKQRMSTATKLSNTEYIKLIKKMESRNNRTNGKMISEAFNQYNCINEPKHKYAINKMLKLCSKQSNTATTKIVFSIWTDIIKTNNLQNVSHELLLKNCSNILRNDRLSKHDLSKSIKILQRLQLSDDMNIKCALINALSLNGQINESLNIFHSIADSSKVNDSLLCAMMTAHINSNQHEEALALYQAHRSFSDEVSHLIAIKTCMHLKNYQFGQDIIISLNIKSYSPKLDSLMNAMIGFYGRMGDLEGARQTFEIIPLHHRNVIHLTMMMNALCNNGMNIECIELFFDNCINSTMSPNEICFSVALKACIHESALSEGLRIEQYMQSKQEYLCILQSVDVQNKLLCLYGKTQRIDLCEQIFERIKAGEPQKYRSEIKLWNRMISVYARNGKMDKVIKTFDAMVRETKLLPNEYTIIHLLNACNFSNDVSGIKDIVNAYVLNTDLQCFDDNQMATMTRQQLCDTLDLFVLCRCIKFKVFDERNCANETINYCSRPVFQLKHGNVTNFKQILFTVHCNADAENIKFIQSLIQRLKLSFCDRLSAKEYLCILDAYGLIECIDQMLIEYKAMIAANIRLDKDVLICLLHHLIRTGETQRFGEIWSDLEKHTYVRYDSAIFQALMLCINKRKIILPMICCSKFGILS